MENLENQGSSDAGKTENEQPTTLRMAADILETILLAVLVFLAVNGVSARIRVDGTSMEPNLHTGEFVVVNKFAYKLGQAHLGDVIVFHFPGDPSQEYIKRVIGLPGDIVQVSNGLVFVNGVPLQEPYIMDAPDYQGTWIVPLDNLFVLGDNRNNSSDSHSWGTVPMSYVIGKAMFIYWPPDEWGALTPSARAAP